MRCGNPGCNMDIGPERGPRSLYCSPGCRANQNAHWKRAKTLARRSLVTRYCANPECRADITHALLARRYCSPRCVTACYRRSAKGRATRARFRRSAKGLASAARDELRRAERRELRRGNDPSRWCANPACHAEIRQRHPCVIFCCHVCHQATLKAERRARRAGARCERCGKNIEHMKLHTRFCGRACREAVRRQTPQDREKRSAWRRRIADQAAAYRLLTEGADHD